MKTQRLGIIFCLLSVALAFVSCDDLGICEEGYGPVTRTSLSVPTFDGIELDIDADVYLTQAEAFSVEVEGQENIIDRLKTDVDNGILELNTRGCIRRYEKLTFYISAPAITFVKVSGSGSVYGQNEFNQSEFFDARISGSGDIRMDVLADRIDAKLSGSGNIDLTADVLELTADISGSGNINLAGSADVLDAVIRGSGDVLAFDFPTQDCVMKIRGSGDARVNVSQSLDINISGSGNVRYKGQPALNVSITGSGRVIDAN